jgi:hypothetical protein
VNGNGNDTATATLPYGRGSDNGNDTATATLPYGRGSDNGNGRTPGCAACLSGLPFVFSFGFRISGFGFAASFAAAAHAAVPAAAQRA